MMYQFYYRMHGYKQTEDFENLDELYLRIHALQDEMCSCPTFYAEIISPDGTQIQRVNR